MVLELTRTADTGMLRYIRRRLRMQRVSLCLSLSLCGLSAAILTSARLVEPSDNRIATSDLSRVVGAYGDPPCDPQLMSWVSACSTGVDITPCPSTPPYPPCPSPPITFSCNTDCLPMAGEATGGGQTVNGFWSTTKNCGTLGSTYSLQRCDSSCACTLPNPTGIRTFPCDGRKTTTFTQCSGT